MRCYGISGVKTDASGRTIEEALLHRLFPGLRESHIYLQAGFPAKPVDVARLIARGDRVSVVRMCAETGEFEAKDSVRLRPSVAGYLQSYRDDGLETDSLASLPRY
ncbi:MAG TPA: hypothetical protein VHB46_09265 [Burkholderiales bacterium]|nr:hypothetical protein [Burkholderiales bacterium]